jgi:alanine racemase
MLSQIEKTKLRTWVELDRSAIKKNYALFRKMIKKPTLLMCVVKSNAYGHGLVLFAKEMVDLGIDYLGVDSFEEALELRKNSIKTPIMVFGYVSPAYFNEAIKKNISITISSLASLKALTNLKTKSQKIKIHIKADTGLGRQGFLPNQMKEVISFLKKHPLIEVEGIYTHLAVGENPKEHAYTAMQTKELLKWDKVLRDEGYKPIRHICATSSTMLNPECHFDMVRVGIGMYGLWPSRETKDEVGKKYKLHPVLSWKAIITDLKRLPKDTRIGYDLTEKLSRNSLLAVVPVGYWHGYPRLLSGKGVFNVKGKKVKLIGRVSMDMIVLDVTNVPNVKVGDEVAIIGGDSGHYAEADMMAQDSDTINYEITTRINPIIKRFYRINPLVKRFVVEKK